MKRIILFMLSLILTFSLSIPVFASTETAPDTDIDTENEITIDDPDSYLLENDLPESEGFEEIQDIVNSRSSSAASLVFKKISTKKAKAQAYAARGGANYIKSTIKLQVKKNGSYSTVSNGTSTKSVYDNSINHICSFAISSGKTYRIKVSIKYTENGYSHTDNYYKSLDKNGY